MLFVWGITAVLCRPLHNKACDGGALAAAFQRICSQGASPGESFAA
jgi:hypothetical protein